MLQIAAFYSEPQICRFLLSNHAEVDNYVFHHPSDTDSDSDDGYFSPLAVDQPLFDWSEEYEKKMQECNKLLLESGADPMLKTEYGGTAFFSAFTSGNLVSIMAVIFSLGLRVGSSGGDEGSDPSISLTTMNG